MTHLSLSHQEESAGAGVQISEPLSLAGVGAGRRAIGGWERGRELAPSVIRNTYFTLFKFKIHIRFATMAEQVYMDTHSIKLQLSIRVYRDIFVYIRICVYTYTYIYSYVYRYRHTHTYTHMYTNKIYL